MPLLVVRSSTCTANECHPREPINNDDVSRRCPRRIFCGTSARVLPTKSSDQVFKQRPGEGLLKRAASNAGDKTSPEPSKPLLLHDASKGHSR